MGRRGCQVGSDQGWMSLVGLVKLQLRSFADCFRKGQSWGNNQRIVVVSSYRVIRSRGRLQARRVNKWLTAESIFRYE